MTGVGWMTRQRSQRALSIVASGLLAACATVPAADGPRRAEAEIIQLLAINDFHGNIEVPASPTTYFEGGERKQEVLGGAARLGATLARLRAGQDNTITVAAGDLISASPLASA